MLKFMLIILDGFGLREEQEGNAVAQAHTPNLDHMLNECPVSNIETSGKAVGLPDGVINMVTVSGKEISNVVFEDKNFAGLHFTGSTEVFRTLWKNIGNNIEKYKSYPRIVGETGGKDFIVAHKSAIAAEIATAISRGAFEYQGQKCSAASRAYIPSNLWDDVKTQIVADSKSFKIGTPEDKVFDNSSNSFPCRGFIFSS